MSVAPSPLSPQKLRIAITGGGLAGAAIANALVRQPHLDVHIYESAPVFSERGMAVNLSINAQRALAAIVPDGDAVGLLRRAGAVPLHSARVMMVSHFLRCRSSRSFVCLGGRVVCW